MWSRMTEAHPGNVFGFKGFKDWWKLGRDKNALSLTPAHDAVTGGKSPVQLEMSLSPHPSSLKQ